MRKTRFNLAVPALAALAFIGPATAQPELTLTADFHQTIHVLRGGIGASWHAMETPIPVVGDRSHGGSGWGGYPPAGDDAAWRQIYRHADWLGLDFCRVEIEQRIYEPERNQFTWDPATKTLLKSFPPKPNAYFVYGLILRLTAKHSTVVATEVVGGQLDGTNRVFAAALRSPEGQCTWIIVE